jgi:hypothetical protein
MGDTKEEMGLSSVAGTSPSTALAADCDDADIVDVNEGGKEEVHGAVVLRLT